MIELKYKISVIIPVYNMVTYIERCIESVLSQSFNDYEIVLIDDGSTDGSAEICDRYKSKHSNIVVCHQKNSGLSLARKTGIDLSSGLYAFFLDSDDWLPYSNVLELLFNQVIEYSADFVSGNHITTENTNLFQKTLLMNNKDIHKTIITDEMTLMYNLYVSRKITTSAWGKLIKRNILKAISFQKDIAIGEEHDLVTQILQKVKKAILLDAEIYAYYQHTGSISKSGYNEKYTNSLINYIRIQNTHCEQFSGYKKEISAFYCEYEMAVITAMCRNWTFNRNTIKLLCKDLRRNMKYILLNPSTKIVYKLSAVLISYTPYLFIILFRIFHLLTGR